MIWPTEPYEKSGFANKGSAALFSASNIVCPFDWYICSEHLIWCPWYTALHIFPFQKTSSGILGICEIACTAEWVQQVIILYCKYFKIENDTIYANSFISHTIILSNSKLTFLMVEAGIELVSMNRSELAAWVICCRYQSLLEEIGGSKISASPGGDILKTPVHTPRPRGLLTSRKPLIHCTR